MNNENLSLFLFIITYLSIVGGIISYFVFGIKYLIEDYELFNACENSNLWIYVLITLIITSNKNTINQNIELVYNNYRIYVMAGLIEFGFAIWGYVELFLKNCDSLQSSNLWKFGLTTAILQTIFGSIFISKRNT